MRSCHRKFATSSSFVLLATYREPFPCTHLSILSFLNRCLAFSLERVVWCQDSDGHRALQSAVESSKALGGQVRVPQQWHYCPRGPDTFYGVMGGGGGCPAYYKTVSSFPGLCPLGAPRILSPPCSIWGKPKCFYVLSVLAGGGGGAKSSSFEHLWSRAFYHPPPSFFISWACLRMKSRSYLQDIIHAKYHLSFYALYFL